MNRLLFFFIVLATVAHGADFKHPLATIHVPGEWRQDPASTDRALILGSIPAGREIIISAVPLNRDRVSFRLIAQAAAAMLELRLESARKLSPDVQFDEPEVRTTATGVVCTCHGFAAKEQVRMAIRVDGTVKTVRSTSVYDYTGQPEAAFQRWADAILAGVK